MTAKELLAFLRTFYREKLAIRQRHVAVARFVPHYDFNNTYQYVICREDVQLNWLRDAIVDMGGELEEVSEPDLKPAGKPEKAQFDLIEGDRDEAQSFVAKWRPLVQAMPNARQRSMLLVILGEAMEHKRFFEQALAGRTDLLGRRADGAGTGGGVLATRWIEQ
ncbi:MAG: hypothetical protein ABI818_10705 [Acidobacteriota bacterium]